MIAGMATTSSSASGGSIRRVVSIQATLASPVLRERLAMRVAILVACAAYLPVLWRAPGVLPLVTPAVFLPMLGVHSVSSSLRRRSPEAGALACHCATAVQLLLACATPLCYPRVFRLDDALRPLTFVVTALLLSIIAGLSTFLSHELLRQRSAAAQDGRVRAPMATGTSGRSSSGPNPRRG
jgi:hypothetical protein